MSRSDGEGGPSKCLLNDGHDVREVVDIGMVWQPFTTWNTVESMLGHSHNVRVPSHREKKATGDSIGPAGGEYNWGVGGVVTCMVSDDPTRDSQKGGSRW